MTAPNVTGSIVSKATSGTSLTTATLNVSSTQLICVAVATEKAIGTTCSVTSVTATGVTFTKRYDHQASYSSIPFREELWVAPVTGGTFNHTITVNVDNAVDGIIAVCFGVGGLNAANTSNFDTNAGLPYKTTALAGGSQPTATVTTTQSNDLLISMDTMANGGANEPTGFTEIQQDFTIATNFLRLKVAYKQVTAVQSAVGVQAGSNGEQVFVVDALTADNNAFGASMGLGISMAAALQRDNDLTAAASVGVSMAAALTRNNDIVVAAGLGVSMAAAMTREKDLAAAFGLGISETAIMAHVLNRRQPVICVVT